MALNNLIPEFLGSARVHAIIWTVLLVVYLVCLNTVIMFEIMGKHQMKYEYGMGVLFIIPVNWIYTILNVSTLVLFVFAAVLDKPLFILLGALGFLFLTICQHLLALAFGTYTGYEIWAYLLFFCGMAGYILTRLLK